MLRTFKSMAECKLARTRMSAARGNVRSTTTMTTELTSVLQRLGGYVPRPSKKSEDLVKTSETALASYKGQGDEGDYPAFHDHECLG